MDFSFELIPGFVEHLIVDSINILASIIQPVTGVLPNPDPFPPLIENLYVDDGSLGAMAYFYANQFVDLDFIIGVLIAWFPMFATAWIIQMLWTWAKMKNKG